MAKGPEVDSGMGSGKVTVFFATTFHKKYAQASDKIRRLLSREKQLKADLWVARTPGESLMTATWKQIDAADAVVAVITPGSLLPTIESALASIQKRKGKKKPLYVFLEKRIPNRLREIYAGMTHDVYDFDSKSADNTKAAGTASY